MLAPLPRLLDDVTRIVSAHLRLDDVSIGSVRDEVLHAAARISAGLAGASTTSLVADLEKVTGCSISELARAFETAR